MRKKEMPKIKTVSIAPTIEAPEELIQSVESALDVFSNNPLLKGIKIKITKIPQGIKAQVIGQSGKKEALATDVFVGDRRWLKGDIDRRQFELTKTAVVEALSDYTNQNLFWGSLVGVRPSKLYRLIRERGFTQQEAELILRSVYGIKDEKIRLLETVYNKQKGISLLDDKSISIYIGIPFCPTRCTYCSFAAYPLSTHGHLKQPYLEALYRELVEFREYFGEKGIEISSVYVGGGTPTSLTAEELNKVLSLLPKTNELTVEAGRPDTIDREKLHVLKEKGTDRVCVNPQTLNEKTLQLIGRAHTVEEFFQAVELAREVKIPILNIDLIAGLPKENIGDMENTLEKILALEPENVTVHTLAAKRASTWYKELQSWPLPTTIETEKMVNLTAIKLREAGLAPYYLYRQRQMAANLENIGYAKEGSECYYNIIMIEELQTVVGMGAGASTRFVGEVISRVVNPKCPATYVKRLEELIRLKKENLDNLFLRIN